MGVPTTSAAGGSTPGVTLPWVPQRLPDVIAHRGYHSEGGPYENTMPAFEAGARLGVDMLELDVYRTRDGVLVVNHDAKIGATRIADVDYAQLPTVGTGQRVPTLQEVIALARSTGSRLDVELKAKGYERQAVDELLASLPSTQFEVISFNKDSIAEIERYRPDVRTGLLSPRIWGWLRDSWAWPAIAAVLDPFQLTLRRAERVGADYVSVHASLASERLLNEAVERGIDVHVWTVNDDRQLWRFVNDPRVRGVVTDRPDVALAMRSQALLGAAQLARTG